LGRVCDNGPDRLPLLRLEIEKLIAKLEERVTKRSG